jgi:POT family proton-dependent oligopeptide transporter
MSNTYLSAPVPSEKMPKGIPYIIGNEAAERFSFYGMKGILVIFMTQYLYMLPGAGTEAMSNTEAMANYHLFTTAVYFFQSWVRS